MRSKLFISATKRLGVSRVMQNAFKGQSRHPAHNHRVVLVRIPVLPPPLCVSGPQATALLPDVSFPLMNQITDPALRLSAKKRSERRIQGEAQQPSHHIKSHHTFFPSQFSPAFLSDPIKSHSNMIVSLIR
ncbi:hypothetical protein CGRA01v4_14536 [Colletotrichum graminicola]|nr:hypothetical protein CGRA01v4_14536 [Colletotrichum graminicola]